MTTHNTEKKNKPKVKKIHCKKDTTVNSTKTHSFGPGLANCLEEGVFTPTPNKSDGGINKKTRLHNIIKKLKQNFNVSLTNSNISLDDETWLSDVKNPYFVITNSGDTDLAYIPQALPSQLMKNISNRLFEIQDRRKKATGYSGILDNSMPMNYITSDQNTELGKYLCNDVNPLLREQIQCILTIFSERTVNYLTSLDESFAILNNSMYPSTAFNYLEPEDGKHRIRKAHKDSLDTAPSVLFYFGDYRESEGYLELTEKKCKIFVRPGDLLFFRGNKYKHIVGEITSLGVMEMMMKSLSIPVKRPEGLLY